jgi:hypothetical protein
MIIFMGISVLIYFIVTWKARREKRLLVKLMNSRSEAEAEARLVFGAIEEGSKFVQGKIRWRVLDVDQEGRRALVVTKSSFVNPSFVVLVGRDKHTGRPFFMPVEPSVSKVKQALEWLWGLPRGSWENVYEV